MNARGISIVIDSELVYDDTKPSSRGKRPSKRQSALERRESWLLGKQRFYVFMLPLAKRPSAWTGIPHESAHV